MLHGVDGFVPRSSSAASRAQRERQLSELCAGVPGTRPLNGEASLLETPVRTRDGAAVALRIALPLGFPAAAPELTLTQPVQHPWVDPATRRVAYHSARPWHDGATLVGLVADVRASLAANGWSLPPAHAHASATASAAASSATSSDAAALLHGLSLEPGSGGGAAAAAPRSSSGGDAVADVEARLAAMPTSSLRQLLLDDDAFGALLADAAASSEAACLSAQLRASVEEAAKRNLRLAAEAADIRAQCAIIRSTDFAAAKARYDEAAARQAALVARVAPVALLQQLAAAAAADDAAAEALEARLLGGEMQPDAFLKEFLPLRKRFHRRQLKRAAAAHLLA